MKPHSIFWVLLVGVAFYQLQTFASSPDEVSFEFIEKIIQEKNIKSLEELLPLLPRSIRKNHLLAWASQSQQGEASPLEPRVILFSEDAKLVIAFSGKSTHKNGNRLEIIQFRDEKNAFEMREITFPDLPTSSNAKVVMSAPNPQKCLNCHESDPRPNWTAYAEWPGFYGQNDNMILNTENGFNHEHHGSDPLPSYRDVVKAIPELLKRAPEHPRYRHLVDLKESLTTDDERGLGFSRNQHNVAFTNKIYQLNFRRINRILRASPYFEQFKFALLAAIGRCETPDSFFPEAWLKKVRPFLPPDKVAKSTELTDFERIRFLAVFGVDVEALFTIFDTRSSPLNFRTPGNDATELPLVIFRKDKDVKDLIVEGNDSDYAPGIWWKISSKKGHHSSASTKYACEKLRERSLKALNKSKIEPKLTDEYHFKKLDKDTKH